MTIFYLIRHGEPAWDINEKYKLKGHGRDLVQLTQIGIEQVNKTSKEERLKNAQIILSSPYTRALQTAAILSKELQLEIQVEFDLREWQPDLTFQFDSMERLNELVNEFNKHNGEYPEEETRLWESKSMMKARVEEVLNRYLNYDYVIAVGHGMIFRTQCEVEEIPHASIIEYNK